MIKKKSLKQLRNENMKITDWVKRNKLGEMDEKEEVSKKELEVPKEIEGQMEIDDPEVIERRMKRDQKRIS